MNFSHMWGCFNVVMQIYTGLYSFAVFFFGIIGFPSDFMSCDRRFSSQGSFLCLSFQVVWSQGLQILFLLP
ncbi:hypothetical protein SUGI_0829360 [Cryptomeria japonica]|nr:hypothetical protein SUGI_0829360 [Cryptomeria japonica]